MRLTILPLIVSLIAVDTSAAEPAEFPQKQTMTYPQVGDLPIKADGSRIRANQRLCSRLF